MLYSLDPPVFEELAEKPARRRMQRQVIFSLVLIVALLSVGTGLSILLVKSAPQPPTSNTERPALLVQGLEVKPQTLVESIVGYGTARADRHARITAQVSGEVAELHPNLRVGASARRSRPC
ncbi:MAG: hypothetical protein ACE5I3_04460 [Phycisphaerae bacterium]